MRLRFLLDSTVLIDALRPRSTRRQYLADLVDAGHSLGTTAINMGEVYAGVRPEERPKVDALFESLEFYPATESIARSAGLLKNQLSRTGRTVSLLDMLIAATAVEHDLTLITDNRKEFPIPELKLHP